MIDVVRVDERPARSTSSPRPTTPRPATCSEGRSTARRRPGGSRPPDQPGTHSYQVSPDGRWAFHTYSTLRTARRSSTWSACPTTRSSGPWSTTPRLRAKLAALEGGARSSSSGSQVEDGTELDGWCLKPPGFDPSKRYPLLIHVYGEPAGQTVLDRWGGRNDLWHRMLAQRGFVVVSVDNRGTPAPRGRAWRKSIYRQIGILASKDQAEALRALEKRWPFIDPGRVGIWGWSGGGSMSLNAIFRYPDLYQTAVAVAFISDQRLYDTIYQERYMGLPDGNPDGYRDGSPITFADGLQGQPAPDPRHGRRQLPLPELRAAGRPPDRRATSRSRCWPTPTGPTRSAKGRTRAGTFTSR